MNCPSRTEEPEGDGMNQNPRSLSADTTTRQDLNGLANARERRRIASAEKESELDQEPDDGSRPRGRDARVAVEGRRAKSRQGGSGSGMTIAVDAAEGDAGPDGGNRNHLPLLTRTFGNVRNGIQSYGKFVGPGFMVFTSLPSVGHGWV